MKRLKSMTRSSFFLKFFIKYVHMKKGTNHEYLASLNKENIPVQPPPRSPRSPPLYRLFPRGPQLSWFVTAATSWAGFERYLEGITQWFLFLSCLLNTWYMGYIHVVRGCRFVSRVCSMWSVAGLYPSLLVFPPVEGHLISVQVLVITGGKCYCEHACAHVF